MWVFVNIAFQDVGVCKRRFRPVLKSWVFVVSSYIINTRSLVLTLTHQDRFETIVVSSLELPCKLNTHTLYGIYKIY
jgi:hypothetical protein